MVGLADSRNPLSLTSLADTLTVNGRVFKFVFDATTRTVTSTSAAGRQSTLVIDPQSRLTHAQVAELAPVTIAYAPCGCLASFTLGVGVDARAVTITYNAQGYVDTVTDPLGRSTRFAYDAAGHVTQRNLPDGRALGYTYDANGNLTSIIPPGRPVHAFSYTAANQMAEYRPPVLSTDGSTVYGYDLDRKVTGIKRPDGQLITFGYDATGRLSTETLPTGFIGFTYDAITGKPARITAPDGGTLDFTRNGGLLTKETTAGTVRGGVGYVYDNDFRIASITVNDADPVAFTYDADGLLTQAGALALSRDGQNGLFTGTTLGVVNDASSYNSFAEHVSYVAKINATPALSMQFSRDKLGRITQKVETISAVTHIYNYDYDLAGRLAQVKQDGAITASYTYDNNGNRLTGPTNSSVASYDDQDRLLTYDGSSYTYKASGELTSKISGSSVTRYDYDALGNLKQAMLPDGTTIDYIIDGRNRRIGKKVNGALDRGFLYQSGLQPIAELDGTNNVVIRFVYGPSATVPAYMVKGGVTFQIVTDHLGSPRLVINTADGSIAQRMDYDEFGRVILDSNPGFQPFGFAGGLYDRDTKFVHFGARDYDAETGRWAEKDPIMFASGDSNLYAYTESDPVNHGDRSGLCDDDDYKKCRDKFLREYYFDHAPDFANMLSLQSALGLNGLSTFMEFWLPPIAKVGAGYGAGSWLASGGLTESETVNYYIVAGGVYGSYLARFLKYAAVDAIVVATVMDELAHEECNHDPPVSDTPDWGEGSS